MQHQNGYHLTGTGDSFESPVIRTKTRGRLPFTVIKLLAVICAGIIAAVILFKIYSDSYVSVANHSKDIDINTSGAFHNASLLKVEQVVGIQDEEEESQYEKHFKESLSQSERDIVQQFRRDIQGELTHDYMNTTSHLSKWLKARDWDLEEAKEMLLNVTIHLCDSCQKCHSRVLINQCGTGPLLYVFQHLAWREELDIDSVNEGNFTYFEQEFRFYADGYDFEGRPVISINVEDWNLRKASVGGNERELLRYIFSGYEKECAYLRERQAEGKNVSQVVYILNLDNFSIREHGCFSCISTMSKYMFGVDDNYPGLFRHMLLINVSEIAEFLVDMLIPYLSGENGAAVKLFGTKKADWQREILSLIPADQIRPEFGGTKIDLEV